MQIFSAPTTGADIFPCILDSNGTVFQLSFSDIKHPSKPSIPQSFRSCTSLQGNRVAIYYEEPELKYHVLVYAVSPGLFVDYQAINVPEGRVRCCDLSADGKTLVVANYGSYDLKAILLIQKLNSVFFSLVYTSLYQKSLFYFVFLLL